jgi:hydrogenase maturation protein HypF
MTSGNLSDEPIAIDNAEALARLAPIADAFLLHDREIRQRYDDSVVRVVAGATELVRRSRGYAPFPLHLPFDTSVHILAAGPEQKSTFCLARGTHAFVSQHIGDMENAETLEAYEHTLALYQKMFRIRPGLVAYDLHPEYLSTKFAKSLGLPSVGVQHHHAHIASVTAEHGIAEKVVGIAYDGTGYGTDGTIWGGEVLLADWAGFERFAHLRPVPMPGGAAAIRRPARMASGLLSGIDEGLFDHPGASILQESLATDERATLRAMATRGLNSPLTSSMGRLFDAVAALAGVRADAMYEGQAAIELEALADRDERGAYHFALTGDSPIVIDHEPMVRELLDDLAAGVGAPTISARFHNAVVAMSLEVASRACERAGVRRVALAGGVFMNRLVLAGVSAGLLQADLVPLVHRDLPVNDGDISYGQAVVAWALRDTV